MIEKSMPRFFKNEKASIIWLTLAFFILLIPEIFYASVISAPILDKIGLIVFSQCLQLLIFGLFRNHRIFFYLHLPFVLLGPFVLLHSFLFKRWVNAGILFVLFETSINEAREFLSGHEFAIGTYTIITTFLYFFSIRKISTVGINKFLKAAQVTALLLLPLFFFIDSFNIQRYKSRFVQAYPNVVIYNASVVYSEFQRINRLKTNELLFSHNSRKKDTILTKEIYVLVIGESSRYKNWGLNGYDKNTTPLLSQQKNLINFNDTSTSATLTRTAIPILLTRATASTFNIAYKEKSVISAFKEAGFKTFWISNQGMFAKHNTLITLCASESDSSVYINKFAYDKHYDEDMLPIFNRIVEDEKNNKIFVVLHPLGSHWQYGERYPSEFEIFTPSIKEKTVRLAKQNLNEITNSFDNSICYTDYYLNTILETLADIDAISALIYISDHGEDLFDDSRKLALHGNGTPTVYVAQVPMFVWTSALYNEVYPEKQQNLIRNKSQKISTDNIFYSILDLANITYSHENLAKSFASETFRPDKRRLLTTNNEVIDYDSLKAEAMISKSYVLQGNERSKF